MVWICENRLINKGLGLYTRSMFVLNCRINDNEGAAEMLIDTLGPVIVNTADSKNR